MRRWQIAIPATPELPTSWFAHPLLILLQLCGDERQIGWGGLFWADGRSVHREVVVVRACCHIFPVIMPAGYPARSPAQSSRRSLSDLGIT